MNRSVQACTVHIRISATEILRGGTFVGLVCIWFVLLCIGTAFGSVSIGDSLLVIKDFGLFLSSLGTVLLTVVSGAALISKDIKQKHIYTILSKPISRFEYLAAKWMGIWMASLCLNVVFHCALIVFIYAVTSTVEVTLLYNIPYLAAETLVLSSLCLLIASIFVTPLLVGIISFFLFVVGRNAGSIDGLLQQLPSDSVAAAVAIKFISAMLPHLHYCNIVNELTFGILPSGQYAVQTIIYCCSYAAACFIIASKCFSVRNFN